MDQLKQQMDRCDSSPCLTMVHAGLVAPITDSADMGTERQGWDRSMQEGDRILPQQLKKEFSFRTPPHAGGTTTRPSEVQQRRR